MSEVLEWRIKLTVHTADKPIIIDQKLNTFPLQGFPKELAINVGSQEEKQVIKDWHYFDITIYRSEVLKHVTG